MTRPNAGRCPAIGSSDESAIERARDPLRDDSAVGEVVEAASPASEARGANGASPAALVDGASPTRSDAGAVTAQPASPARPVASGDLAGFARPGSSARPSDAAPAGRPGGRARTARHARAFDLVDSPARPPLGESTARIARGTGARATRPGGETATEIPSKLGDSAAVATAGGPRLSTTVVDSPLALERHRAAWQDLVAQAAEPNPFFEPDALLAAWRHLRAPGLRVVLVWAPHPQPGKPPRLVGLVPLGYARQFKALPVSTLTTWSHLYAYLATPLVRADMASAVVAAVFAWMRDETDAVLIEWQKICVGGAFHHALIDALNRLGFEAFCERGHTRALFAPAADAETYLNHALGGKKRKELRRQERRLVDAGRVTYDELAPSGDLEAWLDEFVALEQRGWKGRIGTALHDDPSALAVFRDMARGAFARGAWMTLALRLDGRAIAMKCNLRAGPGAIAFKIAYDEAYARFSPGVLLELEQIRRLHDPGAPAWMDSGAAPDHPMIGHLWRDRLAIESLVVPTGRPPGALAVAAMPLVRWASRTFRAAVHRLHPRG